MDHRFRLKNLTKFVFPLLIAITLFFFFYDWQIKKDAFHEAALYEHFEEAQETESNLIGKRLDDWPLITQDKQTSSVLSMLHPTRYTAIILSSLKACSACRDQELEIWEDYYAKVANKDIPIVLLIGESDPLDPASVRRIRAGADAIPISFPWVLDQDSLALMAMNLTPKQTPVMLLVDSTGLILNAYHPSPISTVRSHRFVKDFFQIYDH